MDTSSSSKRQWMNYVYVYGKASYVIQWLLRGVATQRAGDPNYIWAYQTSLLSMFLLFSSSVSFLLFPVPNIRDITLATVQEFTHFLEPWNATCSYRDVKNSGNRVLWNLIKNYCYCSLILHSENKSITLFRQSLHSHQRIISRTQKILEFSRSEHQCERKIFHWTLGLLMLFITIRVANVCVQWTGMIYVRLRRWPPWPVYHSLNYTVG